MYSFGKPGVVKYNGYDGWIPWQPVFQYIDSLNSGKSQPVAGFQFHEYALNGDMVGSIDFAIERYKLAGYDGPVFAGEMGFGYGVKPPTTEEAISQLMTMNARYGSDDRFCGYALYDIRKNAGEYAWDYAYGDITRALIAQNLPILPISNFVGATQPAPPTPPPSGTRLVNVAGLYLRTNPGGTKITIMPYGTQVQILESSDGWARVQVDKNMWQLATNTTYNDFSTWQQQAVVLEGWCSEAYLK
jgi:hypothetical protein